MKQYETLVIFDPSRSEGEVGKEIERFSDFLREQGVEDLLIDNWGKRELAFTMKKAKYGTYVVYYFSSNSADLVERINASLRINENVLKFQTHRVANTVRKFKGRLQSEGDEQNEAA